MENIATNDNYQVGNVFKLKVDDSLEECSYTTQNLTELHVDSIYVLANNGNICEIVTHKSPVKHRSNPSETIQENFIDDKQSNITVDNFCISSDEVNCILGTNHLDECLDDNISSGNNVPECEIPVLENVLPKVKDNESKKKFVCEICNASYFRRSALMSHLNLHTGENLFNCGVCNKRFLKRSDLLRHMVVHTGIKEFSCEICNKTFTQKSYLSVHILKHTNEKPFQCELCLKRFFRRAHMNLHMALHKDEKAYTCDICNKSFKRKGYLNVHRKTHDGSKDYACELCDKKFTTQSVLQRHLREAVIHNQQKKYICEVCNKQFALRNSLKKHLLTHSANPVSCDICNALFLNEETYNNHLFDCKMKSNIILL